MNTFYSHTPRDGHRAETEIDLGDRRVLSISTRKSADALISTASVSLVEGNFKRMVLGFGGDGDFNQRFLTSKPKRVTEKSVREQHAQALLLINEIKQQVEMHYSAQEKRKATAHA